jgi:ATP-binding cassette subfamily C protein CydC
MKALVYFMRLFRPHYARMGLGTLLGSAAILASVGLLALSGWFISAAAFAGLTLSTAHLFNFFVPSVGVRVFAISRTLARYAERLVSHDATFAMLATLRAWFYRKIEPLAPARLMRHGTADLLNRVVADIDALDNLFVRVLSPSVVAVVTVVVVTVLLSTFDPAIAAAALLFMMAAGLGVPWAAAKSGALAGEALSRQTRVLRVRVVEGIQGLAELSVYGTWREHLTALDQANRALVAAQLRMSRIRGAATAATTLLSGFAVTSVFYLGVELVHGGHLDGAFLALMGLALMAAFEALLPLPWAYQYLGQTRAAARRLLTLVEAAPEVSFPEGAGAGVHDFDICLEAVDFRYTDSDPWVLRGLDFTIGHGRRVAIVGETGTGKSTLVNLLVRFWDPVAGTIRIGGQDLRHFGESDLRRMINVVSQHAHLFNETIRHNLLLARPQASDDDLKQALEKAQLLGFVDGLPQGLETWLGPGGRTLSGGQARRLALARAFLKEEAPIWVLDEPTEGLDRATEQKLMQALWQATAGRTVVLITHRTADLGRFDEIMLMEGGCILARGDHMALMRESRRYVNLMQLSRKPPEIITLNHG